MDKVGVIGAGTMGGGIAQVFLRAGREVAVYDVVETAAEKCRARIEASLNKLAEKGKLPQAEAEAAIKRLSACRDLKDLRSCDLVVEACLEEMDVKRDVMGKLSGALSESCVVGTNTSSLSVTEIASAYSRPERVIGIHFFNPAPVMALVEITRGANTSEAVVQETISIVNAAGKTPVVVVESPGFVVNRLLVPMINEAAALLAEGVSDAASIDQAMKLGCNHPIGPLALADMIGVDIIRNVMLTLQREFGDDKYRVHPLIQKMVRAGHLGVKTKKGFYAY